MTTPPPKTSPGTRCAGSVEGWSDIGRSRRRQPRAFLLSVLATLTFPGCLAVGPDYVRPAVPEPAAWHADLTNGLSAAETDPHSLTSWWTTLDDPVLSGLIEGAVAGNLDVRAARARVREARARRVIAQAGLFPVIDAAGSARHSRSSGKVGPSNTGELYSAGFDASWELDVFGGLRRGVEAAEADIQATEQDLRDVLVSLLAEVAVNYVDVRLYQAGLSIAEANLNTQTDTYEITRWRAEAGLTTQLDVEQAKSQLETTRAQLPSLRKNLEQAMNRLAVLSGEVPGALHVKLKARKPIPVTPLEVAVGVPADTLRRRPDVRRAERELAAQTARVGVATADLYPKLSLLGSIGLESLSASDLFSAAARSYGIGPTVSWRIFEAGSIRAHIEVQSALQEQALIRYEAAVLGALEDVNNALTAFAEEQVRRQSLAAAVHAAQRALDLAGDQYASGLIDFQVVLDAQRSLLSLQDQLALSEGATTSDLISLYKALGGGWAPLAGEPDVERGSSKR